MPILSPKHHSKGSVWLPISEGLQGHRVGLLPMCCTGAESEPSDDPGPRKSLTLHNPRDLFLCHSSACTHKGLVPGWSYGGRAPCPGISPNVLWFLLQWSQPCQRAQCWALLGHCRAFPEAIAPLLCLELLSKHEAAITDRAAGTQPGHRERSQRHHSPITEHSKTPSLFLFLLALSALICCLSILSVHAAFFYAIKRADRLLPCV